MAKNALKELAEEFPGLILRYGVSWNEVTYLGVGSGSMTMAEPCDDIELAALLKYCHDKGIGVYILGAGSNIVGSDKPFHDLVVRLSRNDFAKIMPSHVHVIVGAGTKLADFLRKCAKMGLGGAAGLAGIPGTVGGAIRMNASAHGVEMKDIVEAVCGFAPDGSQWCMDTADIDWGYRQVDLPEELIITAATCKLRSVHASSELSAIEDETKWRQSHFPSGRSVGCVFRNPLPGVSAGKLIDEAGCRGARIGGAMISDIHANYFLNDGGATEEDYANLIIEAKKTVLSYAGLYLVPEVCFVNPETEARILAVPEVVRVLVLKGGDSNERAISLVSGGEVEKGLEAAGYHVDSLDMRSVDDWGKAEIDNAKDVVFPMLHGGFGEDGRIQEVLERDGVMFVGCGSSACRAAMDKLESKRLIKEHSLPTPDYVVLEKDGDHGFPEKMAYPVVVKPPEEGSTVGISVVHSKDEWQKALDLAFKFSRKALVESFVKGSEIAVSVLDDKALPVVEIQYPGEIFDYDAKYDHKHGDTLYLCPTENIPYEVQEKAQAVSLEFAKALGARDMVRVDLIVTPEGDVTILEANTIPGFTPSSLLPKSAANAGLTFPQLCGRLVQMALKRKR